MDQDLFRENERLTPKSDQRRFHQLGDFSCEMGGVIPGAQLAYETWGDLSAAQDNAILVCHALSGDSHAIGWWDRLVGPGKAIDTDRFYVIGSNCLGGCQGSTGPGSLDDSGRRLGSRFPAITVGDMVEAQKQLIQSLGIKQLKLVCGGSMGGMQALEWSVRFPEAVANCWTTASAASHSAMQIGFNETARQAIIRDPKWQGGDFTSDDPPAQGLAVARMVGHLSYLSDSAFESKFGRSVQQPGSDPRDPRTQFSVESYLSYQGEKFTKRFDAGSLVALSKAIDAYECPSLEPAQCRYLFTSFTSDWLYTSQQSERLMEMARASGKKAEWHNFDLPMGHDSFLLDDTHQSKVLAEFLSS